jgi:hypothetical protein
MKVSRNLLSRSKTVFLAMLLAPLVPARARAQLGATVPDWAVNANPSTSTGLTGIRTMADIGHEIGFEPVTPCRIVDTRGPTGTFGAPALSPGVSRNFQLPAGPCAGIPAGVGAYSLNVTVTNTAGPGFIKIYPQGGSAPVVSTLNYVAGQTVANAAIVPAGTGGGITVVAGVSGADLILDINGYYSQALNSGNYFSVVTANPSGGGVIFGENLDTTAAGYGGVFETLSPQTNSAGVAGAALASSGLTFGVYGLTASTSANAVGVQGIVVSTNPGIASAGVVGINSGTSGFGVGVKGLQAGSGYGVYGSAPGGYGVYGSTSVGTGIYGSTSATAGSVAAIWGQSLATTGMIPAVLGETFSGSPYAVGVLGQVSATSPGLLSAGVRGINLGTGGLGTGVWGSHAGAGFGVFGAAGTGGVAVFAGGDFTATGVKSFVEPHPTDAAREIRYVALEGPESGTYFRGRGTFQNGLAVIDVPEDFRLVTDAEGLSIQVTPIGAMATVAVLRIDLEKIVVQASRSVDFFYLVNGVRKSQKSFQPVERARFFLPEGPDARMPDWLTAEQKKMLIANGTYKADGTVNMETAKRLGWSAAWEARDVEAKTNKEQASAAARPRAPDQIQQ